ncbi:MAG TPA: SH3 domain-containing C40 family peptidase [Gemmatimonadaceae bacterium]|nr:SH3 domain-containing C40 family peptidase [Gemmatimonadaceae bacterium]
MTSAGLLVTASIAPLLAAPVAGAEQVSQRLAGAELEVMEVRSMWFRVRGLDGYVGWVHSGYVRAVAAREIARRYAGPRTSLGCVAVTAEGRRRALPLGALLADDETVESGEAVTPDERRTRFAPDAAAAAASAVQRFEGAPYQWGGITPWGADCSGMVQTAFSLHGFALPRDARLQAEVGDPIDPEPASLLAGDLIFFSSRADRRVTHVGIALGNGRMVHSAIARGGWAIDSLTNLDDPYMVTLRGRITGARRHAESPR